MKTYNSDCLQEVVNHLVSELEKEELSEYTIRSYKQGFALFQKYIHDTQVKKIDETTCLDYIEFKTGIRLTGLHEKTGNPKISRRIRPLFLLLNYEEEGIACHTSHRNTPQFLCPDVWQAIPSSS